MRPAALALATVFVIALGLGLVAYALGPALAVDVAALAWIVLLLVRATRDPACEVADADGR